MQRIHLNINRIQLRGDVSPERLQAVSQIIRDGFQRLAERMRHAPADWQGTTAQQLQLSTLSPEELLGPRGAEQLADALDEQLRKKSR